MSYVIEIAKELLRDAGRKGMHVSDMAQIAVEQNKNMGLSREVFQKKISSALASNLKTKNPSFAYVKHTTGPRKGKPKQGWYRLKEERTPHPISVINIPQTQKNFLGKGGEYAVMSELLFWEYNVSNMIVDDGIDLIASKNNKFFHIQVKTSSCQNGNIWHFTINKSSFSRYNSGNVFYVFVMRKNIGNDFIIIPSYQISYFLNGNIISDSQALSINISYNEKRKEYILNNKADVTPYFNNFGGIIV